MVNINTAAPVTETPRYVSFRLKYVILPVVMLIIAAVLVAVFYNRLPAETAYRFSDGVPVSWTSRGKVIAWALGLQLVFMFLSLFITLIVTSTARRMQMPETSLNKRLFAIIGNVVVLPQIIIAYAMMDIFQYNIFGSNLPPVWVFALAVMLAGGLVLGVLFAGSYLQYRKYKAENLSGSKSDDR